MAALNLEAMEEQKEDDRLLGDEADVAVPRARARRAALGIGGALLALAAVAAWLHGAPRGSSAFRTPLNSTDAGEVVVLSRRIQEPLNLGKALNHELIIPGINELPTDPGVTPNLDAVSGRACGLTPRRRSAYDEFRVDELDQCNSKCGDTLKAGKKCTAFEFRVPQKKCRIFKVPISATRPAQGHTCSILGKGKRDSPVVDCTPSPVNQSNYPAYPLELLEYNAQGVCKCKKTPSKTQRMSFEDYDDIGKEIDKVMNRLGDACTAESCKQADWGGCVLRMAGHDFMDYDPDKDFGGSDACTDMNNPDNRGLIKCLVQGEFSFSDSLANIFHKFCDRISIADFLVVAAEQVIRRTRDNVLKSDPNAPKIDLRSNFKYGRKTRRECPDSARRLPDPEDGCAAVKDVFVDSLGLTWKESAALMGVHTLGRARVSNSGYSGWWSSPQQSRLFNNDYYKSMVFKGWKPHQRICGNRNKNQWFKVGPQGGRTQQGFATEMMLDTDLCLAYSVDAEGPVGNERPVAGKGPLHARNNTCCAWFFKNPLTDFPNQVTLASFTEVCHAKFLVPSGEAIDDCGSVFQLENFGAAGKSVRKFTEDERAWLRVFTRAWNKATEVGQKGLKGLENNGGYYR